MTRNFGFIPTTQGEKKAIFRFSGSNSENKHYSYILDCLHFLRSKPWVNPDDSDIATRIANMVLEVVPYFQNQADAAALKKGKTEPEAFETTTINLGQNERIEVTLTDLFSLVPSNSSNAWLTDRLMESLIRLQARPYQPGFVWFCSDGVLQTCMAALTRLNDDGCTCVSFGHRLYEMWIDGILPGREIPADAGSIVFFHQPTKDHWITVLAYVDRATMLGHIELFNSLGEFCGDDLNIPLQYLLHCLSYRSRNLRFRGANWFEVSALNRRCPQQSSQNIDCGIFAVSAAESLLQMEFPDETIQRDEQARIDHGLVLREHYMIALKEALDETDIAIQTIASV
ncbi:hypothetical protein EG327_003146 [Venturia inaequalis]|uniref:Ubiquitin-like protease family profile domain-containing protein n=1 Tax=Venturia inaequalis TaxID=5025 RepID=A0A8H3VL75_VENIN|nr:hypothetical protein EG327_003146 [Venturia inaequalis]